MDIWKYFAIGHQHHVICNPTSEEKLDELIELIELSEEARVLDIACGKGAFLLRTLQRWMCNGVGVDLSPSFGACQAPKRGVRKIRREDPERFLALSIACSDGLS